jgi:hypothetical protein
MGRRHPWLLSCCRLLVEFLAVPVCISILLALVCPAARDIVVYRSLADALPSLSLFVAGLLSGRSFAAESVMAAPPCGCFAVRGVLGPASGR